MAGGNVREIGAKITLQGTNEYNNSIRSINSAMGTLRSETRLLSSQYADSQNSLEALTAKHRVLSEVVDKQKDKIRQYEQALQTSQQNLERCSNNVEQWRQRLNSAQEELERMQQSQNATNEEMEEQERAVERAARGLQTAENQYRSVESATNRWQTQLNDSRVELNNLENELDQTSRYMHEAEESTDNCATSIDEYGNAIEEAEEDTSTFGDVLRANLTSDAIEAGLSAIVDNIKEFSQSVMETAGDTVEAMNKIQAATGASEEKMEEYGDTLNAVFNDNFGESMEEVGEAITQVVQQMGEMDGDSLKQVTEDAFLLKDTFDFELNESLRAAKMLMDQFGLSSHEAYNLIAQGAQNGLNKNDDLLDTINEYSVQFSKAGISAEEMFNMLQNGAEAGTWSVDKLGDAFKEFSIRLQDGTSDDALKQLGLDVDEIKDKFNEGGDAAQEAMSQIMTGLQSVSNESERYLAYQTMFGTMFEDLGETGVNALMNVSGEASRTADTLDKMNSVRYNDLNSALETLGRNILTRVSKPFTEASQNMSDGINDVTNRINNGGLGDSLEDLGNIMARLVSAFVDFASTAAPPVISALSVLLDNIPLVVAAVTGLTVAFKYDAIVAFGSSIMGIITHLKTLATIAIESGSAMGALNAVMTLTPHGALVAGIAAITAGLGAFAIKAANSTSEQDKFSKKCEESARKVNDLKNEMSKSDDAFKNNTSNIQAQNEKISKLIEELYRLDGAQKNDVASKNRMKVIVNELNTLNPKFGLSVDEVTGRLNKQKNTVLQLADSFKKQAMAESYQSHLKEKCDQNIEALENEKEALNNLKEALKVHSTLNDEQINDYINLTQKTTALTNEESKRFQGLLQNVDLSDQAMSKSIRTYGDAHRAYQQSNEDLDKLANEMAKYSDSTDDATNSLGKNATAAENNSKAADNLKNSVDSAGVSIKSYGDSADYASTKDENLIDTTSELKQAIEENSQKIREEYEKNKESAKSSIEGQIDYFKKFSSQTDLSAKDIVNSFNSNKKGVEQWHKDLNTISNNTSKDFVRYLQSLGPGAAGEIHKMASMSGQKLKEVERAWKDTKKEISKTVDDTYNDVDRKVAQRTSELENIYSRNMKRESYYSPAHNCGEAVGEGLAAGMNSKAGEVSAAASRLANAAAEAQRWSLGIHSPSRVAREIGEYFGDGNVEGILSKEKDVQSAAIMLGNAATRGLSSASSKFSMGNTNYQSTDYNALSQVFTKALEKGKFTIDRNGTMKFVESTMRRLYV